MQINKQTLTILNINYHYWYEFIKLPYFHDHNVNSYDSDRNHANRTPISNIQKTIIITTKVKTTLGDHYTLQGAAKKVAP